MMDFSVRRSLAQEYARGTGVLKSWIADDAKVTGSSAEATTCVNVWEATSESTARRMLHVERARISRSVKDWRE